MKSRKRARPLPQPEECGVWLDASQLKKKPHQTVIPCIASFHPLSRRQPMNSVLLEFTQTKSPPLCTKQTSMYSFFSPAGSKNNLSSVADVNTLVQQTSREYKKINAQETWDVIKHSPTGSTCSREAYRDFDPAEDQENVCFHEIQRSKEHLSSSGQNEHDDQSCQLEPLNNSVGDFSSTSVCKFLNPPPNYWDIGCLLEDCTKEVVPSPSQSESQLFTQDTQGNRVICHRFTRDLHINTPLRDTTNVTLDSRNPTKETLQTSYDEGSLNKMFTQDSEGNLVIKH